jgi:hypothetical protein
MDLAITSSAACGGRGNPVPPRAMMVGANTGPGLLECAGRTTRPRHGDGHSGDGGRDRRGTAQFRASRPSGCAADGPATVDALDDSVCKPLVPAEELSETIDPWEWTGTSLERKATPSAGDDTQFRLTERTGQSLMATVRPRGAGP